MAAERETVDPRFDPRFQRGYDGQGEAVPDPDAPVEDAEAVPAARPRRWPGRLLAVLGPAMVVAGIVLQYVGARQQFGYDPEASAGTILLMQLGYLLPFPLIAVGLAAIGLWFAGLARAR